MLLSGPVFQWFVPGKAISDSNSTDEVVVAVSVPDLLAVDSMIQKPIGSVGSENSESTDYGWMYYRSFLALAGHIWRVLTMGKSGKPDEMKEEVC